MKKESCLVVCLGCFSLSSLMKFLFRGAEARVLTDSYLRYLLSSNETGSPNSSVSSIKVVNEMRSME